MIHSKKNNLSIKRMLITMLILCAFQAYSAVYKGTVYIENKSNEVASSLKNGLPNVAVSDGLNVVLTDANGNFELPVTNKTRFIFITVPAGYKAAERHYLQIDKNTEAYNFGLIPFAVTAQKKTKFIQITDTETFEDYGWTNPIKEFAANEKASFIVHTGDICYEKGLNFHGANVTSKTMGVPVYYCIGNHDLVKGDYGEQLFEKNFGPTYYSFEAGNTHYIVTPMLGGDYKPSYTKADVYRWMKNDLQFVDKTKNIVVFNHDLLTYENEFIYGINDNEKINLNEHGLKAWICGHWHINYMRKHGNTGIVSVCASPPDKGGIDHSSSNFVVYEMNKDGVAGIHSRYNYLDKHLSVNFWEDPNKTNKQKHRLAVSANFYSTVSQTKKICCRLESKSQKTAWVLLQAKTDWNWSTSIALTDDILNDESLQLRVLALTANGDSTSTLKKIDLKSTKKSALNLTWARNTGGNIWMCSPVYHNGKVVVATMDEFAHKQNAILAYDSENGDLRWRYQTASSIKNTICIEDGLVLATDEDGTAYALDVETGKLKWKKELGKTSLPAYISGNVAENGVFYTGFGNYLSAISIPDGTLIWKNTDWNGGEGTTSTHSVAGDMLITSSNWQALFGHDKQTGKKKWKVSEEGIRFRSGTSVFFNDTLWVTGEKTVVKMNPKTGQIYKSFPLEYNLQVATTPMISNDMIIMGTANNGLIALNPTNMKELWKVETGTALIYTSPYSKPTSSTIESAPVQIGSSIFFGASDGLLYKINRNTGEIIDWVELGSPVLGKICTDGKSIFVVDFAGNLYKFQI